MTDKELALAIDNVWNNQKLSKDFRINEILFLLDGMKRTKIKVPGINQYSHDGPFSENMNPHRFKKGEQFYLCTDIEGYWNKWEKILVTEVRAGVMFYRFIDEESKDRKEHYLPINAVIVQAGAVMPLTYKSKLSSRHYELICQCPRTVIEYTEPKCHEAIQKLISINN